MDPTHLTARIKEKAHALGFDWARVVPVDAPAHVDFYDRWATPAYTGDMGYLTRNLGPAAIRAC
ncbi:MAG: hypothetical protein R2851_03735 [Caldilineaceae bacterium]